MKLEKKFNLIHNTISFSLSKEDEILWEVSHKRSTQRFPLEAYIKRKIKEKNKSILLTTYKEFIDFFDYINKNLITGAIYIERINDPETAFVIIFSHSSSLISHSGNQNYGIEVTTGNSDILKIYIPENEKIAEFLSNLLFVTEDDPTFITRCTLDNDVVPLMNTELFYILLTKAYLEGNGEPLYHKFKITSKNGKVRDIIAPHEEMKKAFRLMNDLMQKVFNRKTDPGIQFAYKPGVGIYKNAQAHRENKYVVNFDLKDFYPSCKRELVEKHIGFLFNNCVNPELCRKEFLESILEDDGLFIGSPISGTLANVILEAPLKYINNICNKEGITFTDYADDLTFSSSKFMNKEYIESLINYAFAQYKLDDYFKINSKKTHGAIGDKRHVTGVAINANNKLTFPRKYWRELRTMLEYLNSGKEVNLRKLRGKISYASMLDESGKLLRYLEKYEEVVKEYNLASEKVINTLKGR